MSSESFITTDLWIGEFRNCGPIDTDVPIHFDTFHFLLGV